MSTWDAGERYPIYYLDFYNGSTYVDSISNNDIVDFSLQRALMSDKPTVGQANAGELEATFLKPSFTIPRMAGVNVKVAWGSSTYSVGWFYIDTRSENPTDNTLTIHCYDAMLMAEQLCSTSGTDIVVVTAIAAQMGVALDSSVTSSIVNSYSISEDVANDSSRNVLKVIGAAYGGSFFVTRDGKLGFAGLVIPPETYYLVDQEDDPITFGGDRIIV